MVLELYNFEQEYMNYSSYKEIQFPFKGAATVLIDYISISYELSARLSIAT